LEFREMIVDLVDKKLCEKLNIASETLENVLLSMYDVGTVEAEILIDTLQKAASFEEFRTQMRENNRRIETHVTKALLAFTETLADADLQAESAAVEVARIVQAQEEEELRELIDKACRQMHAILSIDLLEERVAKLKRRQRSKSSDSADAKPRVKVEPITLLEPAPEEEDSESTSSSSISSSSASSSSTISSSTRSMSSEAT
jgi:hypothetical protein